MSRDFSGDFSGPANETRQVHATTSYRYLKGIYQLIVHLHLRLVELLRFRLSGRLRFFCIEEMDVLKKSSVSISVVAIPIQSVEKNQNRPHNREY